MPDNTTTDTLMPDLEYDCPVCGAPMEVIDRFTLPGALASVEHVKVRCIIGHWFTPPTDSLVRTDSHPHPTRVMKT